MSLSPVPALVLDANILIRAVLGTRVRILLTSYQDRIRFFTPVSCVQAAERYLPDLSQRRGWPVGLVTTLLTQVSTFLDIVEEDLYADFAATAQARLVGRDLDDWPIVALALALNCPIWTEDQDFFGTGIATWTTDRVELYLRQ